MTETKAIELCKEMAKRRGVELGLNVSASLNQDVPASEGGSSTPIPFRHWSVVFWEGFDQEQYFTVNDLTHHVTWKNQPPPKWPERLLFYLVLYPNYWLLIGLESVFEPWYRGWKNFSAAALSTLPRKIAGEFIKAMLLLRQVLVSSYGLIPLMLPRQTSLAYAAG